MREAAAQQAEFMTAGGQTIGEYNLEQAERYLTHILEEVTELVRDHPNDKVKAVDGAVDTIVVCLGYLHSIGIDPSEAWDAVYRANMSKIGPDGKVYRREDGQIAKGPHFKPPEDDLAALLAKVMP